MITESFRDKLRKVLAIAQTGQAGEREAAKALLTNLLRENGRIRFVGEIHYHGKRYRFRSTNARNVSDWLNKMRVRFSD